jgi:hypothetical protein
VLCVVVGQVVYASVVGGRACETRIYAGRVTRVTVDRKTGYPKGEKSTRVEGKVAKSDPMRSVICPKRDREREGASEREICVANRYVVVWNPDHPEQQWA